MSIVSVLILQAVWTHALQGLETWRSGVPGRAAESGCWCPGVGPCPLSSTIFSSLGRSSAQGYVQTFGLEDACCVLLITEFHCQGEVGLP